MNEVAGAQNPITLRWYAEVLRERWRVAVIGLIVGTLLAVLFLAVVGQQVTARTAVRLDVIDATPFETRDAASRLIDNATEAQLASSFEVASRAAVALADGTTAREIRDNTTVNPVADATVLEVLHTAADEGDARRAADAVARAYLDYRTEDAQSRIDSATALIDERLAALRIEFAEIGAQLATYEPDSPQEAQAMADRAVTLQLIGALTNQLYELDRIDTTPGSIISPASENVLLYTPSKRLVLAAGVLGGLLVGAALAFVRNATAKRMSSSRQLRWQLGAPHLGSVEFGSLRSSDLRAVCARLVAVIPVGVDRLLMVDATESDEAALAPLVVAASIAELGETVNVVVAGANRAERAQLMDDFALHAVDPSIDLPVYRTPLVAGLDISFTDGHGGRMAFTSAIERAESSHDRAKSDSSGITLIVVSASADDDTRIVALREVEAVVVFAELGRTRRSALEALTEMSGRAESRVLGAVTVTAQRKADRDVSHDGGVLTGGEPVPVSSPTGSAPANAPKQPLRRS